MKYIEEKRDEGEHVNVELVPEPEDSSAIAFKCMVNGKMEIGYVVKEILQDVHLAIINDEVGPVEFGWVRYIADWTHSGPGYFAGVKVTKKGQWSTKVVNAARPCNIIMRSYILCFRHCQR